MMYIIFSGLCPSLSGEGKFLCLDRSQFREGTRIPPKILGRTRISNRVRAVDVSREFYRIVYVFYAYMSKGTPQFFERSQKKNDLIIYDVDIRSKTFPIASSNDLTCETGAYKIIEINKYKCIIGWGNSHSGDHVNIRCRFFLFVIKKHRRVIEKSE